MTTLDRGRLALMRLFRFPTSHFCEKTQWVLDREGVDYETVDLVPGPHVFTARARRWPRNALPALYDGDHFVQGSSAIIDYVEARVPAPTLEPTVADDEGLEPQLDRELGEMLQVVLFDALLPDRSAFIRFCAEGGPSWASAALTLLWPLMKIGTIRRYDISPATSRDARERFAAAIARLDERVEAGPYVLGSRFSRVDVTAAALLCPIVRPPGYALGTEVPVPLRSFADRFAGSPTWRWVHRMYAEERHVRASH